MNTTARPVCLFLALALAACSGGADTASRPTTFDGEVLRVSFERDDGGKETFSTLRDEWYSWPWFPIMPDQSGRRWTMLKTDREGVSVAYALVSWDNDDPTDYMSAGFWMRFDNVQRTRRLPASEAEIVPFIDGPEIDLRFPPALPVSGTARYVGSAGGVYQYHPTGGAEPISIATPSPAASAASATSSFSANICPRSSAGGEATESSTTRRPTTRSITGRPKSLPKAASGTRPSPSPTPSAPLRNRRGRGTAVSPTAPLPTALRGWPPAKPTPPSPKPTAARAASIPSSSTYTRQCFRRPPRPPLPDPEVPIGFSIRVVQVKGSSGPTSL